MIAVTGHKFTIGKEEYQPYAVEMHYFRVSKRYWSICFERIRRAGFRVISTVVPWSLHEDSHREFDFSGFTDPTKDLIVFIELAREFGFKVILRLGPLGFAEMKNGGLPSFLKKYPEILALDSEGSVTTTDQQNSLPEFDFPSNLHPRMQNFVKHYFNGLTEIVKNYIYPRGPLFLVELDSGTYFGGAPYPWRADYNPHILEKVYPQFLEERYEDIKTINSTYSEKAESFGEFEPPRDFSICKENSLPKLLDWFRFKEYMLKEYANFLIDLYKSFSCEPLFYQTLSFHRNFHAPMTPVIEAEGQVFPTIEIDWQDSSTSMLQKIRYLRANSGFPWCSSISIGNYTEDRETARQHFPISADATRYIITLALAGGVKGFTQYKFVESENWYDSPLAVDGTIQESYEIIQKFMSAVSKIDLGNFEQSTQIGVASYKLNNWLSLMEDPANYRYIQTLTEYTMPQIGRDLDILKQDFVIPDLDNPESFNGLKYVIVPVTEIMDEEAQKFLLDQARKGVHQIFVGLLPKFSSDLSSCQLLANAIHCKTQFLGKIGTINAGKDEFPGYVFGSINCTEKRSKKLVTYANKTVGVRISKFKGNIILLTVDISSQGNHMKIGFLQRLLSDLKVTFPIKTSHSRTRAFVHMGNKSGIFYLLNSSPNQPFKRTGSLSTKVAVQVDLRALGFRGSKLRMTDIFSNEEIFTTVDELKEGLYFSLRNLDSRAYYFTQK